MSLSIASINSGSNGNCYYIGNDAEAVLIDAGISCRETEKRMKRLGLRMDKIKAIFVSHEHSDHIIGINTISKKHQIPVYITLDTLKNCRLNIEQHLVIPFQANIPVTIGDITVYPFAKFHDARNPHSFIVSDNEVTVGVFTDIGKVCERVIHHFKKCDAAFLEANYDEEMLAKGNYPFHLKKRISGGEGHLSNREALNLFNMHKAPSLSHLLLSHLSQNNNSPEIVEQLFQPFIKCVNIVVASRFKESSLYRISGAAIPTRILHNPSGIKKQVQLSLF